MIGFNQNEEILEAFLSRSGKKIVLFSKAVLQRFSEISYEIQKQVQLLTSS
jgi:hypothetical protein